MSLCGHFVSVISCRFTGSILYQASYSYIVEDRAQAKRSYDYLNPAKMAKGDEQAKSGSKGEVAGAAEAKGAKGVAAEGGGGGAKAAAKYDDEVWSKETDYCD